MPDYSEYPGDRSFIVKLPNGSVIIAHKGKSVLFSVDCVPDFVELFDSVFHGDSPREE